MLEMKQDVLQKEICITVDSGIYSQLERLQKYYSKTEDKEYSIEAVSYIMLLIGFFQMEEKLNI